MHSFLRHIHSGATKVLASNDCLREYLEENGYKNIEVIRFGIDHDTFHPGEKTLFAELKKPILLFVGRVAIEKNIEDFLAMKTPGTKVIVGDGPLREKLEEKYPHAVFL